jgi:L-rhamnose-H+ transport protein
MGSSAWPIKLMRRFQYEHWAIVANTVGIVLVPWCVTLLFCPRPFEAYATLDPAVLVKSNLWSLGWGVANVLAMICFLRIGFSLTNAILTGLGASLGVILPMLVKGSGLFEDAPGLGSAAGLTVLAGVAVMLVGVVLVSMAGFGKTRAQGQEETTSGSFVAGLIMAILAGVLSCGISFAFVYSWKPIVDAMKANGASEIAANFAVWAVGLVGGALVNILYPVYLLTKNRSWHVLLDAKEVLLALIAGVSFAVAVAGMGGGMLLLGALGASLGFGVQQASQMLGGQAVGFVAGEWRGVRGAPRLQMYWAIVLLIVAAVIMACGKWSTTG